ncbi:MAG: RNA 2'-phosphotransferase [Planctomycetota bacterium]
MDEKAATRTSKLLSLVLRHRPHDFGVALDGEGWVAVEQLLAALDRSGTSLSEDELVQLVRESDKQRFALSEDGLRIRAQQGHSVEIDLGYAESEPPRILFHGTVERFLASIRRDGLNPRGRHHVHLSDTADAARRVGERRGAPVVLEIRSGAMVVAGNRFYRTPNGVWLTDHVEPQFIRFPAE